MTKNELIEYKYLNIDTEKFCESEGQLRKQFSLTGGRMRAVGSPSHNQVLYAMSKDHFEESTATRLCQKLSKPLDKRKEI